MPPDATDGRDVSGARGRSKQQREICPHPWARVSQWRRHRINKKNRFARSRQHNNNNNKWEAIDTW